MTKNWQENTFFIFFAVFSLTLALGIYFIVIGRQRNELANTVTDTTSKDILTSDGKWYISFGSVLLLVSIGVLGYTGHKYFSEKKLREERRELIKMSKETLLSYALNNTLDADSKCDKIINNEGLAKKDRGEMTNEEALEKFKKTYADGLKKDEYVKTRNKYCFNKIQEILL